MLRLMTIIALCGLLAASAFAFGTEPGTHNLGSEHEKITRSAIHDLGPKTLDLLAGTPDDPGAVGVPDDEGRGLVASQVNHCDGADYLDPGPDGSGKYGQTQGVAEAALTACRAYIIAQLDSAVDKAGELAKPDARNTSINCVFDGGTGGSTKCDILEHLGLAFHAAQDFYAHSNWVDRPSKQPVSATNPPGLGQSGRAKWLDPRLTEPFPVGLISGCPGDLSLLGVTIGCEYGTLPPLLGKFRILRKDLAKDTGPIGSGTGGIGTSPRGRINGNFARAVTAAIGDTADKWAYFREHVTAKYGKTRGAKILCALQGDTYDARLCTQEVTRGNACTERESIARADEDTDVAPAMIAQTTSAERATAGKLYDGLAAFCVIEETDLTRSEVTRGGVAETGKDAAKAAGLSALATWNACPAQLTSVLPAMSQRHKDAYQALMEQTGDNGKKEMTILSSLYADCILAAHQRRTGK